MSETELELSKYGQAQRAADALGMPRGLGRLIRTGGVKAFGEDAKDGTFNPGTDIIVERRPLGRVAEVLFMRLVPHTMSLRNHARRHGGVYSKDTVVTTFKPKS